MQSAHIAYPTIKPEIPTKHQKTSISEQTARTAKKQTLRMLADDPNLHDILIKCVQSCNDARSSDKLAVKMLEFSDMIWTDFYFAEHFPFPPLLSCKLKHLLNGFDCFHCILPVSKTMLECKLHTELSRDKMLTLPLLCHFEGNGALFSPAKWKETRMVL